MVESIIFQKKRIIVIGDLHADWPKTKEIFVRLKLIDNNNKWIAEPRDTIVVQMGDQVDGGGRNGNSVHGELNVIHFFDFLHEQAKMYNGGVYSLIGNHELMNFLGDYRYTSPKDMYNKNKLFTPGSLFANKISNNRNIILKIGDYLFIHAGILPKHLNRNICLNSNQFICGINDLMRQLLNKQISHNDPRIKKYFTDPDSLLWTRDLGGENVNCKDVEAVTTCLNLKSIIVGHSIQPNGINSKCNGKLWRVDVGLSNTFGANPMSVLEICPDRNPIFKIINL